MFVIISHMDFDYYRLCDHA